MRPPIHQALSTPEPFRGSNPTSRVKWRWWYSAIADWMLQHPGKTQIECAKALGKNPTTISLIVNSDIFKTYFRERQNTWTREHDFALRQKMTGVVSKGLDNILEQLETKRDKMSTDTLVELTTGVLDRLGYSPKSGPVVHIDQSTNATQNNVVLPGSVTTADLEEARNALRAAQSIRAPVQIDARPLGVEAEVSVVREAGEDDGISDVDALLLEVPYASIADEV